MQQFKTTHRLAALLTAGVMMGEAGTASAAITFKDISSNMVTSTGGLPALVATVAYIGGTALGVAGIFKMKQHVDNPGQTPLKDGLIRLGAGGGLLALPFLTTVMMNTINNGTNTQATQYQLNAPLPVP